MRRVNMDNERRTFRPSPDSPSVIVPNAKWTKVNWLSSASSSTDAKAIEGDDLAGSHVRRASNTNQISPKMWTCIYVFFGFDMADDSPMLGVWFKSWVTKNTLLAYQMYTVGWMLDRLYSCFSGTLWALKRHPSPLRPCSR